MPDPICNTRYARTPIKIVLRPRPVRAPVPRGRCLPICSDDEMPSDDDETNEAEEYEKWKVREINRIKAYREEREKWQKEKEEIQRRRSMTDEQRRREDAELEKANKKDDVKWNFLQKYYHKGAYFMDTAEKGQEKESIYRRDYGHATGEVFLRGLGGKRAAQGANGGLARGAWGTF